MHLPAAQDSALPARLQIARERVVHETMGGEVILIHLESGNYYSLRGAGADVWALLARGGTVEEIAAAVAARYPDAPAAEVVRNVHAIVADLDAEGLIVRGADGAGPAQDLAPPDGPFVAPLLERYTDMQEYLLVDPIHDVDGQGWPAGAARD